MTELSPAAQAIMDAYMDEDRAGRLAVAAALRVAVRYCQSEYWSEGEQRLAKRMLMISDELEAQ